MGGLGLSWLSGFLWGALVLVLVGVLTTVVPYLFLVEVESFLGSYLYWTLITAVFILLGFLVVRRWGD